MAAVIEETPDYLSKESGSDVDEKSGYADVVRTSSQIFLIVTVLIIAVTLRLS